MKNKASNTLKIAAHKDRIATTHRGMRAGTVSTETGNAIIASCNRAIRRLKGAM